MIIMIETAYDLYLMGAKPAPWARNQTYFDFCCSTAAEHNNMGFINAPYRIFFFCVMNNDRLFLSLLTLFYVK